MTIIRQIDGVGAGMFFLSQLQDIAKYFREDEYFYNKKNIELALGQIAGAKDYTTARLLFRSFCEDLQIVFKFMLEFIDNENFKRLEAYVDTSEYHLPNPKLVVPAYYNTQVKGVLFTLVPEGETADQAKIRIDQFNKIETYIDVEKFQVSSCQFLPTTAKAPVNSKMLKVGDVQCVRIAEVYQELENWRRYLVTADLPTDDILSPTRDMILNLQQAKFNLIEGLRQLPDIVEGLKQNLGGETHSTVMPEYVAEFGYFRHDRQLAVNTFMSDLRDKFPTKKMFCISDPNIKNGNHYFLIKELIISYQKKLNYIIKYKEKSSFNNVNDSLALEKQKRKNVKKFNELYSVAVAKIRDSLKAFNSVLPVEFEASSQQFHAPAIISEVTIVSDEMILADFPKQELVRVNLINNNEIVLAFAEISHHVRSIYYYIQKVSAAFQAVQVLSKQAIDTALKKVSQEKVLLEMKYAEVSKASKGCSLPTHTQKLLLDINKQLTSEFNLKYLRITNKVFDIKETDVEQIKLVLDEITNLKKELANAKSSLVQFLEGYRLAQAMRDAEVNYSFANNRHRLPLVNSTLVQELKSLGNRISSRP